MFGGFGPEFALIVSQGAGRCSNHGRLMLQLHNKYAAGKAAQSAPAGDQRSPMAFSKNRTP
jgi:hypothetical protein